MQAGDLVVCIDDDFSDLARETVPNLPKRGRVYSIRETLPAPDRQPILCVRLVEIVNAPRLWWDVGVMEACFGGWRFRRVRPLPLNAERLATAPTDRALERV